MQPRYAKSRCLIVPILLAFGQLSHGTADDPNAIENLPKQQATQTLPVFALFDEGILADNVFTICLRSAELLETERFDYLLTWVLPNEHHASLSLQIDFAPTQPAPPVDQEVQRDGRRSNSGGRLISPALDLVDAAAAVGKLDELREKLDRLPATTLLDRKNRLALLSIVLLKQKKLEEALGQMDAFCQLCV